MVEIVREVHYETKETKRGRKPKLSKCCFS